MSRTLHPRTMHVNEAGLELSQFVIGWVEKYDLTFGETIKLLASHIETHAKYLVRSERHPDDPDKGGDEA